jgi:ABC-type sulfate transport system substrate-binding protein
VAEAYLQHLYSDAGQDIVARHYFRPRNAQVLARYSEQFPAVPTFSVDQVFGGWTEVHTKHFADGAIFDQIYSVGSK